MSDIPWDKLGIPSELREHVAPEAPRSLRLAAARGLLPTTADVLLAVLYVCAATGDDEIRGLAVESVRRLPDPAAALSQRTHTKVIELLAEVRLEPALDQRLLRLRNINDRAVMLIAARANAATAELLCDDHERLICTPDAVVELYQNPATPGPALERAISFLRMEGALPELPAVRGGGGAAPRPVETPAAAVAIDLDAEIEAALAGKPSPALALRQKLDLFDLEGIKAKSGALSGFAFDFSSEDEFSLDLTADGGDAPPEVRVSIEKKIAAMPPGKKIKLAYLGNKEVRGILIRDRNKQVSLAVIKSGRMTENEALNAAGNRNMPMEVLRELSTIREWMRKYPIKVAIVNNPRTPPSVAVPLVSQLQKKELEQLSRNKNVSSVIFTMALKMSKQKAGGREG